MSTHSLAARAIAKSRASGNTAEIYPGTNAMSQAVRNELYGRCAEAKHADPTAEGREESLYVGEAWKVLVVSYAEETS